MSELRLTVKWVADAVGGRMVSGEPDRVVGHVTTDSRSLGPGDFFIALRGARFDGHQFVGDVLSRGAGGAIVERGWTPNPKDPAQIGYESLVQNG